MSFGDNIDWDNEARRAAKETEHEHASGFRTGANASELISVLAAFGAAGRLLDCGCNIARYYPPLREAGFSYVGVDQSVEALQIAQKRYPEATFVRSFLWDMHFTELFDVAICNAVLQHNKLSEKRLILPKIAAALKTGGFFAMQESTVRTETATQLRHEQWIALVEGFGFRFLQAWHPNPEYGLHDAYLFRRN